MEETDLRGRLAAKIITEVTLEHDEMVMHLAGVSGEEIPELIELRIRAIMDEDGCHIEVVVRPG